MSIFQLVWNFRVLWEGWNGTGYFFAILFFNGNLPTWLLLNYFTHRSCRRAGLQKVHFTKTLEKVLEQKAFNIIFKRFLLNTHTSAPFIRRQICGEDFFGWNCFLLLTHTLCQHAYKKMHEELFIRSKYWLQLNINFRWIYQLVWKFTSTLPLSNPKVRPSTEQVSFFNSCIVFLKSRKEWTKK